MKFIIAFSPQTIAKYLLIIAVILTTLSSAIAFSTYSFNFYEEWMDMLNLDKEMNIPTWFASFLLGLSALLLTAIAKGKKQESDRYSREWKILSYIFWFMAVDEVFSLHEILIIPEVAEALKLPWFLHSMWVIPGTIFVLWFVKYFWKFTKHLPKRSLQHFCLAALLYISGALLMEMVGSYYAEWKTQRDLVYALMTNVEETLENGGTIFFIYGLLVYLSRWMPHLQLEVNILKANSKIESSQ